jgi:hypothetical protein
MSLNQIDRRRRRLFIEGLRAVASFYEQNADAYYDGMQITLNMYGVARHTLCEMARVFGQRNKSYDDRNVTVSRRFNEQITLSVSVPVPGFAGVWLAVRASYRPGSCPQTKRSSFPRLGLSSSNGNTTRSCLTISVPDRLIRLLVVFALDLLLAP